MVHHNKCPLCSSDKIHLHFRCTDNLISKEEFDIYRCSDCGFVLTQDYPDIQSIGKYYESDEYVSHDDNAKGIINSIYRVSRDVMLYKKKRMTERATGLKNGRILDIGCGTGYFAGTMKKAGWEVTGIEPGDKARHFGISKFDLEIFRPEHISSLSNNSFDCITMWHVLEHFHDPFSYSDEIGRLLKPGGTCIVALPNSNSSDAEYYGSSWAAWDVPRHLWHFNLSSFKLFSDNGGFKITRIKSLPLDTFYISILSEKNIGSEMAFFKGLCRGGWFNLLSIRDIYKSSSLIYFLKKI